MEETPMLQEGVEKNTKNSGWKNSVHCKIQEEL